MRNVALSAPPDAADRYIATQHTAGRPCRLATLARLADQGGVPFTALIERAYPNSPPLAELRRSGVPAGDLAGLERAWSRTPGWTPHRLQRVVALWQAAPQMRDPAPAPSVPSSFTPAPAPRRSALIRPLLADLCWMAALLVASALAMGLLYLLLAPGG